MMYYSKYHAATNNNMSLSGEIGDQANPLFYNDLFYPALILSNAQCKAVDQGRKSTKLVSRRLAPAHVRHRIKTQLRKKPAYILYSPFPSIRLVGSCVSKR